jgi:hypothetical protein
MNPVDEKAEYLGSAVVQGRTYNYFRGSDLYVYQFHGDKKIGYLCHLSAWEVFASKLSIEVAA